MSNPFRYFNSSPQIIRLAVLMYVKYPLSLRNVEDLLAERGIDISHETVRFWWNRFGPMFAAEIRKKRLAHMRGYPQWRWHLDEAFVKVNGKLCYLWRAVDHEGEVGLGSGRHGEAGQGRGAEVSQAHHEEIWPTAERRHRRALLLSRGDERGRHRRSPGGRSSAQQSRREFASAVSTTRTGHAAVSKHEDAAKIQLSSCGGPQPFQSGAPSRHSPGFQTKTSRRVGRVARPRGLVAAWVWACCAVRRRPAVTLTKPVAEVALAHGFWELVRSAVQYRQTFGEQP